MWSIFFSQKPKKTSGKTTVHGRRALQFESLETRELLSVAPLTLPTPQVDTWNDSAWFARIVDETSIPEIGNPGDSIGGEWIVQLDSRTAATVPSVAEAAKLFESYGISVLGGLGTVGSLHVQFDDLSTISTEQQESVLAGLPFLDSWQPNYLVVSNGAVDLVNDPAVPQQWALDTVNVASAWGTTQGSGVVVAVLDSGTTLSHPDLKANIWVNTVEIAGNGRDDDGNGFVDDIYGWNFVSNNADTTDTDGHGTHVAGIIGAVANNNVGIAGLAPEVDLLSLKVISGSTGSTANIVSAIRYAIQLKTVRDINIRVMNLSLGYSEIDTAVGTAIQDAGTAGIVVVCSAGNSASNNDLKSHYPSGYNSYDNVISVAATDQYDSLLGVSNYGANTVDLAAPGGTIYSTTKNGSYGSMSGTSMAAPMVSAAVALLAAENPGWSPAQLKSALLQAVDPLPELAGKTVTGGRLNIGDAVAPPANAKPNAPSGLTVLSVSNGTATLQWSDNSKNETSFELQHSTDSGVNWSTVNGSIAADQTRMAVPAADGEQFRIRAVNANGESAWSTIVQVSTTKPTKPAAPTGIKAAVVDSSQISVAWNAVKNATAYRVERSLASTGGWTEVYFGSDLSFADFELKSSTKYYYRVFAVNLSVSSNVGTIVNGTTAAVQPGIPQNVAATVVGPTSVRLLWNETLHATSYRVERSDAATNLWKAVGTVSANTFTDNGLKASTSYQYRVVAISKAGASGDSAVVSVTTPIAVPSTPTSLKAVADGSYAVNLSWKASAGATAYRVEYSLTGKSGDWQTVNLTNTTETGGTVSNLAAGMKHFFHVCGLNSSGESTFSTAVSVVSSAIAPEAAPESLTAVPESSTSVRLQWDAVPNATTYYVERLYGSLWKRVSTVTAVKTECVIKSLSPQTEYSFRIIASSPAGTSQPGEPVSVTTLLKSPSSPTLKVLGSNSISVSWNAVCTASGYIVQRTEADSITWTDVYSNRSNPGTLTFTDTGLDPYTQYSYRIIATASDSALDSAASPTRTTMTAPDKVSNVEIVETEYNQVVLAWDEVDGATSYKVERLNNGRWVTVKSTKLTELAIKSLKPLTDYSFRVVAVNKIGAATPSDVVAVQTLIAPPTMPKSVKVFQRDATELSISWKPVEGAASYLIERYDSNTKTWDEVDETTQTFFVDDSVDENTSYGYRVTAINSSGSSKPSAKVTARTLRETTVAGVPSNLDLLSKTKTSAKISFTPLLASSVSYRIQWGTADGVWEFQRTQKSGNGLLNLTGLKVGTTYFVRIRLDNGTMISDWSEPFSFTL